jgi:hypothetical protein
MAGTVKPATPASIILREIIQASVDEARPKRNAARRSFHNLPAFQVRKRIPGRAAAHPEFRSDNASYGNRVTDCKVCYFGLLIHMVIK